MLMPKKYKKNNNFHMTHIKFSNISIERQDARIDSFYKNIKTHIYLIQKFKDFQLQKMKPIKLAVENFCSVTGSFLRE